MDILKNLGSNISETIFGEEKKIPSMTAGRGKSTASVQRRPLRNCRYGRDPITQKCFPRCRYGDGYRINGQCPPNPNPRQLTPCIYGPRDINGNCPMRPCAYGPRRKSLKCPRRCKYSDGIRINGKCPPRPLAHPQFGPIIPQFTSHPMYNFSYPVRM
jgi:hypothetical protein